MHFKNREEAGRLLADKLSALKVEDSVVFALPRGGVVLGYEVAKRLGAPLSLIIVRKIGHPENPEYALCAVSESGGMLCNKAELESIDKKWLRGEMEKERDEAIRRSNAYLAGIKHPDVTEKTAIIVDDGVATGLTLRLAIKEAKRMAPKRIIVAVPIVPNDVARRLREEVDDLVALDIPDVYLGAVGAYYGEFQQVGDEEVIKLLKKA